MVQDVSKDTGEIRRLFDLWQEAARTKNVPAVTSLYTDDIVGFDAVMALRFRGLAAYTQHWERCMAMSPPGEEHIFEFQDITIHASGDIGFGHCLCRCGARTEAGEFTMWMRLSFGFRREHGHWKIAHEHSSAPFDPIEQKLLYLEP